MEQRHRSRSVCRSCRAAQATAALPTPELSPLRPGVPQSADWRSWRGQVRFAGQYSRSRGRTSSSSCQIAARTVSWKGRDSCSHRCLRTGSQPSATDLWQLDPGGLSQARRCGRCGVVSRGRCAPPPAPATQTDTSWAIFLCGAEQESAAHAGQPSQPIQVHHAAVHGRDGTAYRATGVSGR